jgi:hypothetical protein
MKAIGVPEKALEGLKKKVEIARKNVERFIEKYKPEKIFVVVEDKEKLLPHIRSWGDYFVADIFVRFRGKGGGRLDREIKKVMFDIMASKLIYGDKDKVFLDYIEVLFLSEVSSGRLEGRMAEYLWLLKNYYVELGLWGGNIHRSDVNRIVSEIV